MERMDERCAAEVVPFDGGRAFFRDEFPYVWDMNKLRLDDPERVPDPLGTAEGVMAPRGLEHRRLVTTGATWAERHSGALAAAGWVQIGLLVMLLRGSAPEDAAPAREFDYDDLASMREEIIRGEPWSTSEEIVRQLLDKNKVYAAAGNSRYFGVEDGGGVVSACDLYFDGTTAQVEDVATLEAYRRKGYGNATVSAAVRAALEAGAENVFLVADADDWPKGMYERLGFRPAGRYFEFTRRPA